MGANYLKNNQIIFKNIIGKSRKNQFEIMNKGEKYDNNE
jgi:hypothetical protein